MVINKAGMAQPRNTNWGGRLSTVDLLIKVQVNAIKLLQAEIYKFLYKVRVLVRIGSKSSRDKYSSLLWTASGLKSCVMNGLNKYHYGVHVRPLQPYVM